MSLEECRKTALHDNHVKHGGRIVDFAGWALPVQYESIIKEHKVRPNKDLIFGIAIISLTYLLYLGLTTWCMNLS